MTRVLNFPMQDLVLLHGWAMSRRVWEPVIPRLSEAFRVHNLDLPGYRDAKRFRSMSARGILDEWSDRCASAVPAASIWMGWSLGAMLVMNAVLRNRAKIRRAILVSATPKFVREEEWDAGTERTVLRNFLNGFQRDDGKMLKRFVTLQAGGSDNTRLVFKSLSKHLMVNPGAMSFLEVGLRVLEQVDLRAELKRMDIPMRIIHGEEDRIVPAAAGAYLAGNLPRGDLVMLNTGHAPFVTQPEEFVEAVVAWI